MSERGRRAVRRLGALFLGVALALLGAEGVYRVTRSARLGPTTHPAYVLHDDQLGWSYRPGARATHRTQEFEVEVRFNSGGFRGAEWPGASEGRRRVLVLGDSFAFGWGVAEEHTFTRLLGASDSGWDVLNAAVSGYGTDQELLLLRKLLPEIRPDLVVCVFCPNDLYESAGDVAYGKHKPRFELGAQGLELTGVPVPRPWLERVSHAWRAFAKYAWQREHDARRAAPESEWRLVHALFDEMERELGDVPLLIVSSRDELSQRPESEHLDLRAEDVSAFPRDGHWNAEGHAKVARLLRERIRELLR